MQNGNGVLGADIPAYTLVVDDCGFVSFNPWDAGFSVQKPPGHWVEIPQFISPLNHDRHRRLIGRRQPDTGRWFMESPQFQTWISTPNTNLFCHGGPGVGKSVLMASVVERLCTRSNLDSTTAVACLYDYGVYGYDAGSPTEGPRRCAELLSQIVFARWALPDAGGQRPFLLPVRARVFVESAMAFDYLRRCLRPFRQIFLVLDGMQGLCPRCDPGGQQIGQLVSALREPGSTTAANVLITSRSADTYRFLYLMGLDNFPAALRNTMFATLEIRVPAEDVIMMINTALAWMPPSAPGSAGHADMIKRLIWENCGGVFLVAYLHVQWVSCLWANTRMKHIVSIMGNEHESNADWQDDHPSDCGLPLYRHYRRSIQRMRECDDPLLAPFARWVMGLLAAGTTPGIKNTEIQMAWMAWQKTPYGCEPVLTTLLRLCEGLLEVEPVRAAQGVPVVCLVHHSFGDYLKRRDPDSCLAHWYEIARGEAEANVKTECP